MNRRGSKHQMRKTNYNSNSSSKLGDEIKQNKNDLNAVVIP